MDGRRNQFDPFSGNDPRASPVNRRATAYFQYAAWTTISQMLWRPADARHAACAGVTRRTDPRRFVPCHDGLLYACSMMARSCATSGLIAPALRLSTFAFRFSTFDSALRFNSAPVPLPTRRASSDGSPTRGQARRCRRHNPRARTTRASARSPRCSCALPRSESART